MIETRKNRSTNPRNRSARDQESGAPSTLVGLASALLVVCAGMSAVSCKPSSVGPDGLPTDVSAIPPGEAMSDVAAGHVADFGQFLDGLSLEGFVTVKILGTGFLTGKDAVPSILEKERIASDFFDEKKTVDLFGKRHVVKTVIKDDKDLAKHLIAILRRFTMVPWNWDNGLSAKGGVVGDCGTGIAIALVSHLPGKSVYIRLDFGWLEIQRGKQKFERLRNPVLATECWGFLQAANPKGVVFMADPVMDGIFETLVCESLGDNWTGE